MSSFIDNPVVASLASLTGLTKLLGANGTDAAASGGAPHSPVQRPEYQLAHPMMAPRPMNYGSPSAQGTPVTSPGALSPETLQSPTVQQLLAHFGVSSNVPLDNHLFIHDPQAFAKHPLIAGAIDGALSGLANTRGADTLGEGLSNVAQGLMATHAQQVQQVNNQLMAPIMQASAVAQLQDQVGKQGLQEAQQKHDNAMSDYYNNLLTARDKINERNNDTKADIANNKPPTAGEMLQNRVNGRLMTMFGLHDPSQATPDQQQQAYLAQIQDEAKAGAAGKVLVKKTVPGKAASSTPQPGQGKFSQADQRTYADLDNQVGQLSKQVDQLNSGKATDENGVPIIDPKEIETRKAALFQRASQLRTQQGALAAANGVRMTRTQPASAPAASTSKITHQYIPGKGLVAVSQ